MSPTLTITNKIIRLFLLLYRGDNRYYENLPSGWSVSTLSQITSSQLLNDGDWILSENMVPNGDVKLIQLGSIGLMRYIDKGFKYLTEDTFRELSCVQIFSGYMLINRIISDKMYACILPQLDGKLITTVDTCWIAPKDEWYNLKYLMYFISSTAFQSMVLHISSGTTRKRISKSDLIHLPICFPPLSEQQRIVTRIDELFAQVDIIEQNQADIDTLYDEFRKRTLTFAIQGKLIPQDPNDEPASVLLERIRAEKKVKFGKKYVDSYIYKGDDNCYYEHIAAGAQDEPVEVPFDIPENWAWTKLLDLGCFSSGKTPDMSEPAYWQNGNVQWFTSKDMKAKCLTESQLKITELAANDMTLYPANTLLWVVRSGILKSSLPICILKQPATINQDIKAYQLYQSSMIDYVYYMLKGMEARILDNYVKRITTVHSLKFDELISKLVVPIPPLAEQKRIVAKINEIFAML